MIPVSLSISDCCWHCLLFATGSARELAEEICDLEVDVTELTLVADYVDEVFLIIEA